MRFFISKNLLRGGFLQCQHLTDAISEHSRMTLDYFYEFTGAKWFIEGDIKGCFDNIDHSTLIGVLNRKIKDASFLNLIRMFLKSGYMEDWDFYETYSGCPQGGIISPILANVYLNELDRYITQLKKEFDHGYNPRNFTEEYNAIRHKRDARTPDHPAGGV